MGFVLEQKPSDGGVMDIEAEAGPLLSGAEYNKAVKTPELDLRPGDLREEIWRVLQLAGPLCLQNFTVFLQGVISVAFVGRLEPESLSAMILCSTTFNITGMSVVMGIASGAETLSGQCFGAKNFRAVGVTLQRSLIITWLSCLFIMGGWTQVHRLLSATGQPQHIAELAVDLIWLWWPALIAIGTAECLKRYLMAQSVVVPTCLVYSVCTLLAPPINWVLVFGLGWGLRGSAAAYNIVEILNCVGLLCVICWKHRQLDGTGAETWHGWTRESLKRWIEYLGLALPSTIMLCLEWWTFEIVILMTGRLRGAEVNIGVMGILFQIGGLCYMIPLGLQGAASTRVSNSLGQGLPNIARTAINASLTVSACTQTVIAIGLFTGRGVWGYALDSNEAVVHRIASLLPFLALMVPCDGFNAVFSGIVRGSGRQATAACLNLLTFWGVGLPLAAGLAFSRDQKLGITGLWIAMVAIVYLQCIAMRLLIWRFDWEKESTKAVKLASSSALEPPNPSSQYMELA